MNNQILQVYKILNIQKIANVYDEDEKNQKPLKVNDFSFRFCKEMVDP